MDIIKFASINKKYIIVLYITKMSTYFLTFNANQTISANVTELVSSFDESAPSFNYTILTTGLTFNKLFNGLNPIISNNTNANDLDGMHIQANDRIAFNWTDSGTPKNIAFDLDISTKVISINNLLSNSSLANFLTQVGNNIDTELLKATQLKAGSTTINTNGYTNSMKYISIQTHPDTNQTYVAYLLTNFYKNNSVNATLANAITLETATTMGKSFATHFSTTPNKFNDMIKHIIVNSSVITAEAPDSTLPTDPIDLYANTTFAYGSILAATGTIRTTMIKFQSATDSA